MNIENVFIWCLLSNSIIDNELRWKSSAAWASVKKAGCPCLFWHAYLFVHSLFCLYYNLAVPTLPKFLHVADLYCLYSIHYMMYGFNGNSWKIVGKFAYIHLIIVFKLNAFIVSASHPRKNKYQVKWKNSEAQHYIHMIMMAIVNYCKKILIFCSKFVYYASSSCLWLVADNLVAQAK